MCVRVDRYFVSIEFCFNHFWLSIKHNNYICDYNGAICGRQNYKNLPKFAY